MLVRAALLHAENVTEVTSGNAAHSQLQLDVFGEIMDVHHQARRSGLSTNESGWAAQLAFLNHLKQIWREPDEGLWEVRGAPRHFTHSKVMAWVAFDRAIKCIKRFEGDSPAEHWRLLRRQIHDEVCANAFDSELGAFVQSYGSKDLDASVLLIPLVGFLPPHDRRVRGTIEAIERHLMVDGFVRRYDPSTGHDGLPGNEGAFLACSFWLADNLMLIGRAGDARRLFERLLALRNDVGLLSEQYDPAARRLIGNFPQAFSHIALVNTAHNLSRAQKPAEQRSGNTARLREVGFRSNDRRRTARSP